MKLKIRNFNQAFTLIELSIVLVIIGLIVGGILTGRDLVYHAQLRKTYAEMQRFKSAYVTFVGKYNCVPGDCTNATDYFGTNSSGCPAGGGTTGTCNGNGDGYINQYITLGNVEHLYALQQLCLANMIPFQMLPANAVGGTSAIPLVMGINIPASSVNSAIGYFIDTYNDTSRLHPYGTTLNSTYVMMGAISSSYPDDLWGAGVNGPFASALDTKFDDGFPRQGDLRTSNTSYLSTINANTTCETADVYSTSASSGCVIFYRVP
jgi:prepilin-type N-terminal cleavage/methylation domain-containing protein